VLDKFEKRGVHVIFMGTWVYSAVLNARKSVRSRRYHHGQYPFSQAVISGREY